MASRNTLLGGRRAASLLRGVGRIYMLGIGGISMSSLARLALARGIRVDGEDIAESKTTEMLRTKGIGIVRSFRGFPEGTGALIYSAAVPSEHPAFCEARRMGIPTLSRSDFLAAMMHRADERITVAGMHGKSTVTAMIDHILEHAGLFPTTVSGATLATGDPLRIGRDTVFVAEACEYTDSFLSLSPTVAVALNLEFDHPDYFQDIAAVKRSFLAYLCRAERAAVLCGDDPALMSLRGALPPTLPLLTFGLDKGCDVRAKELEYTTVGTQFSLCTPGDKATEILLPLPGICNVTNALAAISAVGYLGVSPNVAGQALRCFRAPKRRMQYRMTWRGVAIYDDYAHHPTEIRATLTALRAHTSGRLICVFQSHTYSRTRALLDAFGEALRLADRVLVLPIYAARETDTLGVDAESIARAVGDRAETVRDQKTAAERLREVASRGDLAVVMGAGDVDRVIDALDPDSCR